MWRRAVLGIAGVLLGTVFVVRAVRGGTPAANPAPSGPLLNAHTLAANDARSNAAERADQQAMRAAQQGLYGTPLPKDGSFRPPTHQVYADPIAPLGIMAHPVPRPGWSMRYHITNGWANVLQGQRIFAIAGSRADDPTAGVWNTIPEQGVLVILESRSNLDREYLTPARTGQVTITAYSGACLTLTSTANTTYRFNVSSRTWGSCN